MCAITASFNKSKLKELYKLNSYRGELSYSLCTFGMEDKLVKVNILVQEENKMPAELIDNVPSDDGTFFVAHSQAPTTNTSNVHPAVYGDALLWHNGIIKQKNLTKGTWDTQWLLEQILNYGWSSLSRVDGTFACAMYWGNELYVFRNEISPLFFDYDFNFSSTKFEGSFPVPPNVVHRLDLKNKVFFREAYFETFENPYYIPEL